MQQIQVSPYGIAIRGRDDLDRRVARLNPATREAFVQAVARQAQSQDASAIATYYWLPVEEVEALVADCEQHPRPATTVPGTQADALRFAGFDPVALGGKVVGGKVFKPDANPDDQGRCANCGKPGVWISGAGRYLCARHQDDY